MTQPIALAHNDTVRLATWAYPYDRCTATVGTCRGYLGMTGENAHQRELSLGRDTAWTTYGGASLVAGKAANDAKRAAEDAALARAIILADGDLVEIEGETFKVKVAWNNTKSPYNSDPIRFIRQA